MKILRVLFNFVIVTLLSECSAYKFLGVFPLNAKSHYIVYETLMKGLAKRGHQVDVISHFPLKDPLKNYNTIIDLSGTLEDLINNLPFDLIDKRNKGGVVPPMTYYGDRICNLMGNEKVQKFIKNPPMDPPYDAVIVEAFVANCFMGLGYLLKVPIIAISSGTEYPWVTHYIGNDDNLAYVPNALSSQTGKMNFWERVKNVVSYHFMLYQFHDMTLTSQTNAMRKYLSPDIPNVREIEKSVALMLTGSHPIMHGVKPITPMLVQIAGLHIEENDEILPPDLKKWMDESKDGVVYFSFGSMVLIESIETERLKNMYPSFEKIAPVRVLIKIVDKTKLPPGLPSNVKISPWLPQIPILAHPNTKAFITHGGLGGSLEALYFGVPMIGMPLFGDQLCNCKLLVEKEMMIMVDFKEFPGKSFDLALTDIIQNKIYKAKAVYYSKLFRDQPMSSMDKAYFWIDYVIRNGPALRSPALDFTWWQLALLDVYALLLFMAISILIILFFTVKFFIRIAIKLLTKTTRGKSTKELKKFK